MTYQVSVESLVRDGFRSIAKETAENVSDKAKESKKLITPETYIYTPEPVVWHVDIGSFQYDFKYDDEDNLLSILSNIDETVLDLLRQNLSKARDSFMQLLAKKEPRLN